MTRKTIIALLIIGVCPYLADAQYLTDNKNTLPRTNNNAAAPVASDGDNRTTPPPAPTESPKKAPARIGPWQKADDQSNGNISRSSLAKLKAANTALISFLKDSCLADSTLHPVWHGEYTADKKIADANLSFGIRCNFIATQPAGATRSATTQPATLSIIAGDFNPILRKVTVYNQEYAALATKPSIRNGSLYFEPATSAPATSSKTRMWLVTPTPDNLPYTVLSRKDYLEKVIGSLNIVKEHIISDVKQKAPTRSAADQEAEKNKELESFRTTYTGAELQLRQRSYLEHYKSDEDYQKEKIDAATADVDSTISFIDGMLHHLAPATLAAPAVVMASSREFEGFADGEQGSVILVQPKPAVIDPATPEKPGFFLITWNYNTSDAAAATLDSQITRKLDPRVLKNMLKK